MSIPFILVISAQFKYCFATCFVASLVKVTWKYIGSYSISLEPVFEEGSLLPTSYNVVNQEKEYCGGIKVGLKFTPETEPEEVLS